MPRNAIEIENVSKRYLLGEHHGAHGTLRDTLTAGARRIVGREAGDVQEVWSLRDVTLSVPEGQALGVIGRNGAGKSTLLKVITRITEPTSGVTRTRGRVGSLLEVGTGFHPELTGRENVYLNGAILGMSRREIASRFDDIAEFSGVERFLETPVKRYSSGMYLRLAFAVAAHLDSEIMAIDEVLAVGDAEFQRKCLGKMGALESEGRTVVFVSHNLDAIARLCRTAVWLERGRVEAYGPTAEVITAYLAAGITRAAQAEFPDRPGEPIALRSATLLNPAGEPAVMLDRDRPFTIQARFTVHEPVPGLDITVFVESLRGARVLDEAWSETAPDLRGEPGEYVARVEVPPLLAVGDYAAGLWIGSAYATHVYEEDVLRFRLEGSTKGRADRVLQLGLAWEVQRVGGVEPVAAKLSG
jgi:ABC-2 type transport system ATP-binding protein/lipopolysaccharide transport system ATP-binding protein